jgi:hypothetical protein
MITMKTRQCSKRQEYYFCFLVVLGIEPRTLPTAFKMDMCHLPLLTLALFLLFKVWSLNSGPHAC